MTLEFGLLVPQGWRMDLVGISDLIEAHETMTRVAQEAEALGFASIWLFDHFHTVPEPTQEVTFECWTSTAALARDTTRVRLGQIVTCNGYRNPALLAKMASTKYSQVHGAINQPKGVQKPHIPLLIGGGGEKVTLKLVAQYADACNISNPDVAMLEHKLAVLKTHCEGIGRDYHSIKRTVLLDCAIAETEEAALAKGVSFPRDQALIGTPEMIRQRLAEYEQAGAQEMILWMPDAKDLQSIRLFAKECMQRLFAKECMQQ